MIYFVSGLGEPIFSNYVNPSIDKMIYGGNQLSRIIEGVNVLVKSKVIHILKLDLTFSFLGTEEDEHPKILILFFFHAQDDTRPIRYDLAK